MDFLNQLGSKMAYETPFCETDELTTCQSFMTGSLTGGNDSLEGMNRYDNSGWSWDE